MPPKNGGYSSSWERLINSLYFGYRSPIRSDYETILSIRSDPKWIFWFRNPNESDRIRFGSVSDRICTPLIDVNGNGERFTLVTCKNDGVQKRSRPLQHTNPLRVQCNKKMSEWSKWRTLYEAKMAELTSNWYIWRLYKQF
jgi:hypothetical protein